MRTDVEDEFVEHRRRILAALARLSAARSTEAVRRTAPRELAEACGFTRAMISAVRGSRWVPLTLHTRHDLDPRAAEFLAYVDSDAEIPLANMLAETDVVRRRTAVLVDEHLVGTRAFKPIIEIARSPAYVVAPILVEGRTIGFMHADRVGQGRQVDEDDRRCIQAFTSELAVLYQCASWSERITERTRRALTEMERTADALGQLTGPVTALPSAPDRPSAVAPDPPAGRAAASAGPAASAGRGAGAGPGAGAGAGPAREERWLTAREYEILEHVADGATNRVIAQRLSVSEDTVKTHVRSVLRKLRVTSRGAAVARYLELGGGIR
ncbi:MAG TPA: LuxR C-terminal-related transcriptional regulator [Pseudonocardia sp.]|nr:LuxR C-terminal-related transcriptional regulator [Pseudonocardia sp.]